MVGHSRGLLAFVTYAALVRRPKTNVDHRITPLKATNDIYRPKAGTIYSLKTTYPRRYWLAQEPNVTTLFLSKSVHF